MRVLMIAAFAAVGLTTVASATTVLTTTQADVKRECKGKTSCSTVCSSTYCNYTCDDPKKQCTVGVQLTQQPPKGPRPLPFPTDRRLRE